MRPTNMAMMPGADALAELAERQELAQVAAEAEGADALDVEDGEADEGQADGDVHVAGRRPEQRDPADEREQAAPVAEQDVDEQGHEQRDVLLGAPDRRATGRSPAGRRTGPRWRSGRGPGSCPASGSSASSPTIISTLMIHIVRIVLVMLMSQVMSGGGAALSLVRWCSSLGGRPEDVRGDELEGAVDVADRVGARLARGAPCRTAGRG